MLEAIRKRSAGIVVKILLGMLILSFAVWGIPNVFRDATDSDIAAWVGDREIQTGQLSREFQWQVENLRRFLGQQLDMEQIRAMGLRDQVLGTLIENTLFDIAAGELGVTVSDRLVRDTIRNNSNFFGALGKFDRAVFNQFLQSQGMSEQGFVERLRRDLARSQLVDSVWAGGTVPKALLEPLYRYRRERRVGEVLVIADRTARGIGDPDPGALAKFHKDNAARFTAPEYRALTVLRLQAERLAREIAIAEEEIEEAFAQREGDYSQPERRRLQQILTDDEATAKDVIEKLSAGRDFAELGEEMAGEGTEFVDLGLVGRDELLAEMSDAAFSLPEGGHSQPIRSPLGWHVIRVSEIEAASHVSLDEVRRELTAELASEKAIDSLYDLANRLEDTLGGGATLEEAAAQLDLELLRIGATDRNGLDPAGTPVEGLPAEGKFLETAFATFEGSESNLSEAGPNGYFIVRVDGVTPPTLRPLESVSEEVAEAWKREQRATATAETAQAIVERLRNGAEPSAIAAEMGIEVTTTAAFTRAAVGAADDLPRALIDAIFTIQQGDATTARGAEASYVARLKEVRAADPYADQDVFEALGQQITRSLRDDLKAQLANALRGRYEVSVNQKSFDTNF